MCGMFNLDKWDNDATYLVIDDMAFESITNRKALWGSQKEIVLTDKFLRKRSVKWGKPMIVIQNPGWDFRNLPFGNGKGRLENMQELEWYTDNCVVVTVTEPMYVTRRE